MTKRSNTALPLPPTMAKISPQAPDLATLLTPGNQREVMLMGFWRLPEEILLFLIIIIIISIIIIIIFNHSVEICK